MTSRVTKSIAVVLACLVLGVVFATAQSFNNVYSFDNTHGAFPQAALVQGTDGNFYGTTYKGGSSNYGTVFKVTPGGKLTTLHNFTNSDGAWPYGGLVQGTDGSFYGTTSVGGTLGGGSVFKITASGTFTSLYSFGGQGGTVPYGTLVEGTDGNFYGTTTTGGTGGKGTVFQITPHGVLTVIYNFSGADGATPWAGMVKGSDGNLYGTTTAGGASNLGTVFSISYSGTLTTLYSFSGLDGATPYAGVIQASDGNFYGTTLQGGSSNNGTIYQLTPAGALTTKHSFCSPLNCTDGSLPYAGVVQGADGAFYGTASAGGAHSVGTVYKILSDATFTTLHAFTAASDGSYPYGGVTIASSGNLYGAANKGGASAKGTIFAVSPTPYQFTATIPCRLVDTRQGSPITGGTYQTFDLRQLAQDNGCGDLSAAGLYSLNVTLVPIGNAPVDYLTIWPAGQSRPLVSTMNSPDGRIKANAAIVAAGTAGKVNVYLSNTADIVLDIDAYFQPATGTTMAYYPLPPCRVADTRNQNGDLGGPYLQGQTERDFPILESACGIPGNAVAYSLNFTAVPYNGAAMGYLTVWPAGQTQPLVSTLNNLTATYVANAAIVPAGTGGAVATFPSNDTHLVIDVDGYFAQAGQGGMSLYPVAPCRVLDTRSGGRQPFHGTLSPPVDVVGSGCAVPASAEAYAFNATVVPSGYLGYLTLWPDGQERPTVSTLNAADGWTASNMALVPSDNGKVDGYAAGTTHLILDISSFFAP